MNAKSDQIRVFISHSQRDEQFPLWPGQSEALATQTSDPSAFWRLGPEHTHIDSYRRRFSVAAITEGFESSTGYDRADSQASPSWPTQTQSDSGTPTMISVVFRAPGPDETSLIDPYSPAHQTFFVRGSYESNTRVSVGFSPIFEGLAAPLHAENWENDDDLRFDLLVKKEALDKLSLEEAKELEQLSSKRDRTVARVSDEDLLRERMRHRALIELRALIEKYAPLFA